MGLVDRIRSKRTRALRWTIVTSAPKGEAGEQWGDTWFARDLADALRRAGQHVKVVSRSGGASDRREDDDVVLVLRGLRGVQPPPDHRATWIMWVISHPDSITEEELRGYDAVFAASEHWNAPGGVPVTPLLQATAAQRFRPDAAPPDSGWPLLFVGSTRGQFRPAVRGALRSSRAGDLAVFGVGWDAYLPSERITGEFLSNEQLPAAYAAAGIVLNDHHPDMADRGFLSNRLFDAVASGARVLSDRAVGIEEVFGAAVVVFDGEDDLVRILQASPQQVFPDRESRLHQARRIAQQHSFDARARVLVERAQALRGVS